MAANELEKYIRGGQQSLVQGAVLGRSTNSKKK